MFTKQDWQLIIQQCYQQYADTPKQIAGFAHAYVLARLFSVKVLQGEWAEWYIFEDFKAFVYYLAEEIEPRNSKGLRRINVSFANGQVVPPPTERVFDLFLRACFDSFLTDEYKERELTPNEAYVHFESIHPFEDGNGRLGHLLWAIASQQWDGVWPMRLPPKFGTLSALS